MAYSKAERDSNIMEKKITHEELMAELAKYRKDYFELTKEQEDILIEARKMKVPYTKIIDLFYKRYGIKYKATMLNNRYIDLQDK